MNSIGSILSLKYQRFPPWSGFENLSFGQRLFILNLIVFFFSHPPPAGSPRYSPCPCSSSTFQVLLQVLSSAPAYIVYSTLTRSKNLLQTLEIKPTRPSRSSSLRFNKLRLQFHQEVLHRVNSSRSLS